MHLNLANRIILTRLFYTCYPSVSFDFSDSHAPSTLPSSILPNTQERAANGGY